MFKRYHRDEVFVAGGQPSVTYVDREELDIERRLARALATPNQIVSLAGPTKTGKTVLCRKVLGEREYVWVDGGQITSSDDLWGRVCNELSLPDIVTSSEGTQTGGQLGAGAGAGAVVANVGFTASGSRLSTRETSSARRVHSMREALSTLIADNIVLVVDDFHYISRESRVALMRNVKGAVFNGLKVLLLSVTHRAFDAIKAEHELTGRFAAIAMPEWSIEDLSQIAKLGFHALNINGTPEFISKLAQESQESPFLMQKFCWETCFDWEIEYTARLSPHQIPANYMLELMFERLANDAGLPIYQQLVAGPQSRKKRTKRPLRTGKLADIYEVTLLAIAETGPKPSVSYDELRTQMNSLLTDMMPQKHEITSALKHLANISMSAGQVALDWDEDKREVNIADPYLRFYLRWQVRHRAPRVRKRLRLTHRDIDR